MMTASPPREEGNTEEQELMVDSGTFTHAVPPDWNNDLPLKRDSEREHARAAGQGQSLEHYGYRMVPGYFEAMDGSLLHVVLRVDVFNVRRALFSSLRAKKSGVYTHIGKNSFLQFGSELAKKVEIYERND